MQTDWMLIRLNHVPGGDKFAPYVNTNKGESAIFKGVPIAMLNDFRNWLGAVRGLAKVRYRGPRIHRLGSRSRISCQTTCLKADAVTFTVYRQR